MRIKSIKVKNFRTLQKDRASFEMDFNEKFQIIAGANNSGKSNLLRALNLFFNGFTENRKTYSRERDFSFHKGSHGTGSPVNTEIEVDLYLEENEISRIKRLEDFVIDEHIIRTKYIYRVNGDGWYFANKGDGRFPSKLDDNLIFEATNPILILFRRIKFIFIPTHEDLTSKINDLVADEILPSMVDGYGDSGLSQKIKKLKEDIDNLDKSIKEILQEKNLLLSEKFRETIREFPEIQVGMPINEFALEVALKGDDLASVLSKRVDLLVKDSSHNTIESKGSGIQKVVLITLLEYFSQNIESKARYTNPFLIWAIDEPESFMQPKLQKKLRKILEKVSDTHQIIISTHSPNLIDIYKPDNVKLFWLDAPSFEVARKDKKIFFKKETKFYDNNDPRFIDKLKEHLGIEINDGWMLQDKNILFEGQDDIIYFHSTFKLIEGYSLPSGNISCDSVVNMPSFIELLYQKIASKKLENGSLICLTDNDIAGRVVYKKIKSKKYVKAIRTVSLYLNKRDNENENYPSMIEDCIVPEVYFEAVVAFIQNKKKLKIHKKQTIENFIRERKKMKRMPMSEFLDNYFDSTIKKFKNFTFADLRVKYGVSLEYGEIISNKTEQDIEKYKKSYPELVAFFSQFK